MKIRDFKFSIPKPDSIVDSHNLHPTKRKKTRIRTTAAQKHKENKRELTPTMRIH